MRVTGDRDVDAVVDDEARRLRFNPTHDARDERRERRGVEIALPDLDDVDAGGGGRLQRALERAQFIRRRPCVRTEATSIGHQAQRWRNEGNHRGASAPVEPLSEDASGA